MNIYSVITSEINNRKPYWSHTLVEILKGHITIGSYIRTYPGCGKSTFFPFSHERSGKELALASANYMYTDIMELPSCTWLSGDPQRERDYFTHFCPVEFFVPKEGKGDFGFVGGCVWGDDSSMKVRLLDLRDADKGKISKIDIGYVEYYGDLKDAIKDFEIYEDELSFQVICEQNIVRFI